MRKTYGQRFREIRRAKTGDDKQTVVEIAQKLGRGYTSTVYNIERMWRVPNLPTLARHAEALGCQPWELLEGVVTEYDLIRELATLPPAQAAAEWRQLLAKYTKGAHRGEHARAGKPASQPDSAKRRRTAS